jgi:hypothetical protein
MMRVALEKRQQFDSPACVEEPDGFVSTIEVVRGDGSREIVRVQRVGLRLAH